MKELDPNHYTASIQIFLLNQKKSDRFPSDEEFERHFASASVYDLKQSNKLIMTKLENHFHPKEPISNEKLTIEHVLPQNQNLSEDWIAMLGENWKSDQDKYLHTVGNLSLTGYNSEMRDKPFPDKRAY